MNKKTFKTFKANSRNPKADAVNEAGGVAYKFDVKHALAQYCMTGCFNDSFYISGEMQLDELRKLCDAVSKTPKGLEFIAKTAAYARREGFMKDTPAFLVAYLSTKSLSLLKQVFPKVIDNGKMLRNFCQIIRSGVLDRKSFGSAVKGLICKWFTVRDSEKIFKDSVGNDPSFSDIIKMVHPTPKTKEQSALFGYLIGSEKVKKADLPSCVKQYEKFKAGKTTEVPDVNFQMLTSLEISEDVWKEIAKNAPWHMTRMNLNTFKRHNVFSDKALVKTIANRLKDAETIKKVKVFPYQLLMAYLSTEDMPHEITEALQDAMELATENIPSFEGDVVVCPDVSGSMGSAVTGNRGTVTSKCRCIDIAALVSSAVLRKNPSARIIPFEQSVVTRLKLNSRDSVMSNAQKLASIGGGGTNCSAPLAQLNKENAKADLVIYVSDNESWVDSNKMWGNSTETMKQWNIFKKRNPKAKMVCIDIQANTTSQAKENKDILNIGGFSDRIFEVISMFVNGSIDGEHWVGVIEKVQLD